MKKIKKTFTYCLAVIFSIASALNIHGGVWCIEASGQAKMEIICSPCCTSEEDLCSAGEPGTAKSDHAGCQDCSDFSLEALGRLQEPSTEIAAGESEATAPPIFFGPLTASAVVTGCCYGSPANLCGLGAVCAPLEATVLRC